MALHYADPQSDDHNHHLLMQPQPTRLILLDTVPGGPNANVWRVIQAAASILQRSEDPKTRLLLTRNDVTRLLMEPPHGLDSGRAQWLASMYDARQQDFSFDIATAQDLLREMNGPDNDANEFMQRKERVLTQNPTLRRVDLVRGGKNTGWEAVPLVLQQMQMWTERPPNAQSSTFHMHVLPEADHWVHIDDLEGLLDALNDNGDDDDDDDDDSSDKK